VVSHVSIPHEATAEPAEASEKESPPTNTADGGHDPSPRVVVQLRRGHACRAYGVVHVCGLAARLQWHEEVCCEGLAINDTWITARKELRNV
jgi:hypothetical protein